MTDDELVEIMARAQYAANSWWRAVGENDDGRGRYKTHGDVRLRALDWEQLDLDEQDDFRNSAQAIVADLHSRGLAVVPVEPTPEMIDAGTVPLRWVLNSADSVYRAMLAARPKEGA